ncbi:HutD family protein OS=Streptomyces lavendulae subsp. lavendulae OX=58340 GN=SLAV_03860 PE=4 SV=1 [Streptomyces lavendulae subsp. lavendulae]
MYRRASTLARTAVVRGEPTLAALPGETLLVCALDGPAVLEPAEQAAAPGPAVELGPYDAALLQGPATVVLRTPGRAAVVTLRAV